MTLPKALPIVLCIPARNEEAVLPGLLDAIARLACDHSSIIVCILLDNCRDGSAAFLEQRAETLPHQLVVSRLGREGLPNAGVARHAAMTMGLALLDGCDGLLFTTDADSVPDVDWIAAGCKAAAFADVVAGRIRRSNAETDAIQSRIEHYFDRLHRHRRVLDPVPWEARDTHHFGGGANMAIRASTYRAIGGFKPLVAGEDANFLDDAARAGFWVRRDGGMQVATSSRREGRATGGLADTLRSLDIGGAPRVGDPRAASWQWAAQAVARQRFAGIDQVCIQADLGDLLGLTADHILGVARDCPNAEAFAMRVVPASPSYREMVTLTDAEDILAAMETELCGIAA